MKHNQNDTPIDLRPFENLFKKAQTVALEQHEKQAGLAKLEAFLEAASPAPVRITTLWSLLRLNKYAPAYAAALLIFCMAGTSFAAGSSLPGDLLYSVKIGVNEKIESFFAFTPAEHAQVEAAHAEARLQEATLLALNNKLDPVTEMQVEQNFTTEANSVALDLTALNERGSASTAASINTDFQNNLSEAHLSFLALSKNPSEHESLITIDGAVNKQLSATTIIVAAKATSTSATSSVEKVPPISSSAFIIPPTSSTTHRNEVASSTVTSSIVSTTTPSVSASVSASTTSSTHASSIPPIQPFSGGYGSTMPSLPPTNPITKGNSGSAATVIVAPPVSPTSPVPTITLPPVSNAL